MQVLVAQSSAKDGVWFSWPVYRRTIVLIVIASLVSFTAAWVIKGEFAKLGGVRWATAGWFQSWARGKGHNALTNEGSYLNVLKIPYYLSIPVELPKLIVDIKFRDFEKLRKKRDQALASGVLITEKDDLVPAKIRHDGQSTKVKVRLKGDQLDHLIGKKWSFRVKVKGDDHLFGMRLFSVQSAAQRGFHGAPLFYYSLKRYGILAPRYELVDLVVNGNNLGIMSVEEHFSKEMLESNGRKESVIIKFDESLVWSVKDGGHGAGGLGGHFDNYHVAQIDGYGSGKISRSEILSKQYSVAVGLLRAFERGELAPSEVFDAELMGRFIAVSELWGSWHSFSWRNIRFYFNPLTAKLEPIGNDPDVQYRSRPGEARARGEPITAVMRDALLDDPEIFVQFKKAVKLISDDIEQGSFIAGLRQLEDDYLTNLRNEYFLLQPFDESELKQRASLLEEYTRKDLSDLYQVIYDYPELLQAYQIESDEKSYLELANITPSLVEIQSINWVPESDSTPILSADFIEEVEYPLVLPATPRLGNPIYKKLFFDIPPGVIPANYQLLVSAKVSGSQEIVKKVVAPYYEALQSNPVPQSSLQHQASLHSQYLMVNSPAYTMTIKPGIWQVGETIVVPQDFVLEISAGTTLQFGQQAGIVSRGALRFRGTRENAIKLQGINSGDWFGVAVLNANDQSTLSHVVISGTRGMNLSGWGLTGGVTFYKSNVAISDSNFEDSRGEDALNIIHSKFTLNNVSMVRTASDAFDADFSTGEVVGGTYRDIGLAGGGDAIDISGSQISVSKVRFLNIDDKALSVGEGSQMTAFDIEIDGAGTGAASKDGSSLKLNSSTIRNAQIAGLMAYVKKPEFGSGGRLIAMSMEFGEGFDFARVQKGSFISIDDSEIESIDIDVDDMYQTVMKKGLN